MLLACGTHSFIEPSTHAFVHAFDEAAKQVGSRLQPSHRLSAAVLRGLHVLPGSGWARTQVGREFTLARAERA
ncbi:hypothetical protein LY78DRAFT_287439 [Colletotrichum sublineola]|nr:hypothetical protein LY78DRAFT_287439 [Colletotrichum sublineola]